MTEAVSAIGRRYLPRGWRDLALQLVIWFGFLLLYQVARGIADRNPARAFENGFWIIQFERHASDLIELSLQQFVATSVALTQAVSWTYWLSQFTVVGVALLWAYLRHNDVFYRFRNWILLANVIGLVGYVLVPTAPPRLFPSFGFADTLAQFAALNHGSGLIELAANPYAAMPSLHAADSLIVGITLACLVRRPLVKALWLVWPGWVWFSVMATANHFWLDIAAGVAVALVAWPLAYRRELARLLARSRA